MGTWVSQNGMAPQFLGRSGHELPPDLFEQAVIIGGDADTDALEPGQGLDQLARIVRAGSHRHQPHRLPTGGDLRRHPQPPPPRLLRPGRHRPHPRNARIIDYTIAIAGDQTPLPPGETTWNYTLTNTTGPSPPCARTSARPSPAATRPDRVPLHLRADDPRRPALHRAGPPLSLPPRRPAAHPVRRPRHRRAARLTAAITVRVRGC